MICLLLLPRMKNDDIKSYEKLPKQEMIFLVKNAKIQRKINLGRYLIKSYTIRVSHTKLEHIMSESSPLQEMKRFHTFQIIPRQNIICQK